MFGGNNFCLKNDLVEILIGYWNPLFPELWFLAAMTTISAINITFKEAAMQSVEIDSRPRHSDQSTHRL